MGRLSSSRRLALEFGLFFLVLPLLASWHGELVKRWVIPQLLFLALLCLLLLLRDANFDREVLRQVTLRWRYCLGRMAALLLLGGSALSVWAASSGDVVLFSFPRERPGLWLVVLLLYPLLSALPQEMIFRVFVFHRYRALFPTPGRMILASAAVFSLAHGILGNWQAPALAFIGGLLFAWTYFRTNSLPLVALEHGIWGDWVFTLGLGQYFYGGHI
jgi:membrane protease YdiL (CAAX protease family)